MAGLLPQAEPPCIAPPKAMQTPRSSDRRAIALVGMMGAGKTTVGRALAERLRLAFADSDEEIERQAGLSIGQLFEQEGEARFRERERIAIADLVSSAPLVLATGGGALLDPGTRRLLRERALTIWLDAPPAILAARLGDCAGRPLLGNGDPLDLLTRLSAERRPSYQEADIHVRTDLLDVAATAEAAEHALFAWHAAGA